MRAASFLALTGAVFIVAGSAQTSRAQDETSSPTVPQATPPGSDPAPADPPVDVSPVPPTTEAPPSDGPASDAPEQATPTAEAPLEPAPTAPTESTAAPAPRSPPPADAAAKPTRHRVLLLLRQDVAWIAGDDPCTAESQSAGAFSCFRDTGSQYLGTPDPTRGVAFDGFNVATTRLIAGYERFFGEHVALTGLFGVVIQGGGPKPVGGDARAFLPIHVELDAAYWPWSAPDRSGQVRPFAVVGGGIAQIDSGFTLTVHEDPDAAPAASQLDNPALQELEVYSKRGTGFVDAGVGAEARITGGLAARARVLGLWSFPAPGANVAFDLGVGVDL